MANIEAIVGLLTLCLYCDDQQTVLQSVVEILDNVNSYFDSNGANYATFKCS